MFSFGHTLRYLMASALLVVPSLSLGIGDAFIENRGQWDPRALFLCSTPGVNTWVTERGVVYDFHTNVDGRRRGQVVRMEFLGGTPSQGTGIALLSGRYNYFVGPQERWASGARRFSEVRSEQVYPGVEARWYLQAGTPRYDLVVAPGADASRIALKFSGAYGLRSHGQSLAFNTALGTMGQRGLYAYQRINGRKVRVPCEMVAYGNVVRFRLGAHDPTRELIIDPLLWGGFLGGASDEKMVDVVRDSQGNLVVLGSSAGDDFPVSDGAYDVYSGLYNPVVSKLSGDGSQLVFATYIGGERGRGEPRAVQVDLSDNVVLGGYTYAKDYPTTPGAFDRKWGTALSGPDGGSVADGFVSKLSSDGSTLLWSTFVGGTSNDAILDIDLSAYGQVAFCGTSISTDFPTAPVCYRSTKVGTNSNVVIGLLNATGSQLLEGTYIGPGVAYSLSRGGNAEYVVAGRASTSEFPVTGNAYDSTIAGVDGFLLIIEEGLANLAYSTYLGGPGTDEAKSVALWGEDMIVAGGTGGSFPTTAGAYDTSTDGGGFAMWFNPAGALSWSTRVGPSTIQEVALDAQMRPVCVGTTAAGFTPSPDGDFLTSFGVNDAMVAKLSSDGKALHYGSFYGGVACATQYIGLLDFEETQQWRLAYQGYSTNWMSKYVTAGQLEAALNALSSIDDGAVVVDGGFGSFTASFIGYGTNPVDNLVGSVDIYIEGYLAQVQVTNVAPSGATTSGDGCLVLPTGELVLVGGTSASTFPRTPGAFDTVPGGQQDGFVAMIDITPAELASLDASSTWIGGFYWPVSVVLTEPATAAGLTVTFSSNSPKLTAPGQMTIGQGLAAQNRNVVTGTVTSDTIATLTGTGKLTKTKTVTLKPGGLLSLTFSDPTIMLDETTIGRVSLSAPAPLSGRTVYLKVSSGGWVSLPSSVNIPSGATSATFNVTAVKEPLDAESVKITALLGSVQRATTITVFKP